MTKKQLNEIMKNMPDKIDMGEAGVWRKDRMAHPMHWWHKDEPDNQAELLPDAAKGKDNILSRDYDNAVRAKLGLTPTLEDFKLLFSTCEQIKIEDTYDLVFKHGDSYLCFPEGRYWLSNFKTDESRLHGVLPYSIYLDTSFDISFLEDDEDEERLTKHTCFSNAAYIHPIVKQDSDKK